MQVEVVDYFILFGEGGVCLQDVFGCICQQLVVLQDDIQCCLGVLDVVIFKVQVVLFDDIDLIICICQLMVEGYGVVWLWNQVIEQIVFGLVVLGNLVLVGCVVDLCDVGWCVLVQFDFFVVGGGLVDLLVQLCILIVVDLLFLDIVNFDIGCVFGLVIVQGGLILYIVIFLCMLGLLVLVVGGVELLVIQLGCEVIMDGSSGWFYLFFFDVVFVLVCVWMVEQQQICECEVVQCV